MRRRGPQLVLLAAIAAATSFPVGALTRAAPYAHLARGVRGSIAVFSGLSIYRRDANGAMQQVTHVMGDEVDIYPAWSRAGTRIAFERFNGREYPGGPCQLIVMNSDGSDLRRVVGSRPTARALAGGRMTVSSSSAAGHQWPMARRCRS